jgi:hypothetical protein
MATDTQVFIPKKWADNALMDDFSTRKVGSCECPRCGRMLSRLFADECDATIQKCGVCNILYLT